MLMLVLAGLEVGVVVGDARGGCEERVVGWGKGEAFGGVVFVGEVGLGSALAAAGIDFWMGLAISSKLDASSSSFSSASSSWNLEAMAAIEPFCSAMLGGGALWVGVGSGSFLVGEAALAGVGAAVGVGGL